MFLLIGPFRVALKLRGHRFLLVESVGVRGNLTVLTPVGHIAPILIIRFLRRGTCQNFFKAKTVVLSVAEVKWI